MGNLSGIPRSQDCARNDKALTTDYRPPITDYRHE